jgi:hypothetical protein
MTLLSEGRVVNETARQCRVKAEAYADFADDTYLYPLLMSAADTIEVLEEKVSVLTSKAGVRACDLDNLASVRFRLKEFSRRLARLESEGDQLGAAFRDDQDFPPA